MKPLLVTRTKRAHRKLFDTERQQGTTLAELQAVLESGRDVKVIERPGDVDVTSSVILDMLARAERTESKLSATLVGDLVRFRASKPE